MVAGTTSEERLQTLLEATVRLSESIDYTKTLQNVVRFVAERFASYSLLDVVADDGRIERVAVAHSDPRRQSLVAQYLEYHPPADLVDTHPVARAIARNEATLEDIDDRWIARSSLSPEHARTMRELELRTLLVVPVTNGARVVGALTCALDRRAQRAAFDRDDVAFAEELGRRAGVAIDNASLFEHERRIAFTLQRASLPQSLPQSAAVRLDAYYRPSRSEATIGGDWYDAFALDDGRIALTIGDIVGKGLEAAVTMGRVRQAMRTAALLTPCADVMLDVADRTLQREQTQRFATGIAIVFDPEQQTIECVCAGHPAPIVRYADGRVERLPIAGPMLGIGSIAGHRTMTTLAVEPGSMLVLFTDGIIEVDRDLDAGERRLLDTLALPQIAASPRPARAIVDAALHMRLPSDDVAVLTATFAAKP